MKTQLNRMEEEFQKFMIQHSSLAPATAHSSMPPSEHPSTPKPTLQMASATAHSSVPPSEHPPTPKPTLQMAEPSHPTKGQNPIPAAEMDDVAGAGIEVPPTIGAQVDATTEMGRLIDSVSPCSPQTMPHTHTHAHTHTHTCTHACTHIHTHTIVIIP